jgi:hypothetical protein
MLTVCQPRRRHAGDQRRQIYRFSQSRGTTWNPHSVRAAVEKYRLEEENRRSALIRHQASNMKMLEKKYPSSRTQYDERGR